MPAVIAERVKSRRSQIAIDQAGGAIDLNYFVLGTNNDLAVRALVEATVPPVYGGMYFHTYTIEPVGAYIWDVQAKYFSTLPKSSTSTVFSFDTTGGTHHITCSRETVHKYTFVNDPAPDYMGAIGVNGDSVEGCDVVIPQYNFTMTCYVPQALVTRAYRNILFHMTGRTNNAPWNGYYTGEVLFLGAQGSTRGVELWELTYKFAASPNRYFQNPEGGPGNPIGIGRDDLLVEKGGWEYLWIRYADKLDVNAKALVRVPVAAYVERVYDEGDFDTLGAFLVGV